MLTLNLTFGHGYQSDRHRQMDTDSHTHTDRHINTNCQEYDLTGTKNLTFR